MEDTHVAGVDEWVQRLGAFELPVLARTVDEVKRLLADIDRVNTQRVAEVVLHDPLMTFKVLQHIQLHRGKSQDLDITTVPRALMMLGLGPFLQRFARQTTLQTALADRPEALEGALAVMSRARHAALYARDWAVHRHDIEADEVTTAALLHDLAELVLWCFAPDSALELHRMRVAQPNRRSSAAQRQILGFGLLELQLALVGEWRLPQLLRRLMDDHHASTPRVLNVTLASAVARHTANGWNDPALPDDYTAIGKLLAVPPPAARERVVRGAVLAAREWDWYGVVPPAAWLPLIG